ncbi:MAG: iron ABC transporter permease, partial [Burkholderiales bacterium]|nr:iron ABC transporter permease [Burkholderiales bacterium]
MNPRKTWPTAAALLLLSLALLLVGASIGSTGLDSLLAARHDPVAL